MNELVTEAISKLSDKNLNKEEKSSFIEKVAKENVDINVGLYTLGELRKTSDETIIGQYQRSFEKYFLKALLQGYQTILLVNSNIRIRQKKLNYTIVNSQIIPEDES